MIRGTEPRRGETFFTYDHCHDDSYHREVRDLTRETRTQKSCPDDHEHGADDKDNDDDDDCMDLLVLL